MEQLKSKRADRIELEKVTDKRNRWDGKSISTGS